MVPRYFIFILAFVGLTWSFERDDIQYYWSDGILPYTLLDVSNLDTQLQINPTTDVKILIHGWLTSIEEEWYGDIRAEYGKVNNVVIIAIDWSKYSKHLYTRAVDAVPDIGHDISIVINELSDIYGVPLSNFHVIGHSLGAHISGFTGKAIISSRNQLLGRITGLDPAGPLFNLRAKGDRLNLDDASFVDIIHTTDDAGMSKAIGHVDFYPNGGSKRQNGCSILDVDCSHMRAPAYFSESVNSNGFIGTSCDSYRNFEAGLCAYNQDALMGENASKDVRGIFYLNTASSSPFALGAVKSYVHPRVGLKLTERLNQL